MMVTMMMILIIVRMIHMEELGIGHGARFHDQLYNNGNCLFLEIVVIQL